MSPFGGILGFDRRLSCLIHEVPDDVVIDVDGPPDRPGCSAEADRPLSPRRGCCGRRSGCRGQRAAAIGSSLSSAFHSRLHSAAVLDVTTSVTHLAETTTRPATASRSSRARPRCSRAGWSTLPDAPATSRRVFKRPKGDAVPEQRRRIRALRIDGLAALLDRVVPDARLRPPRAAQSAVWDRLVLADASLHRAALAAVVEHRVGVELLPREARHEEEAVTFPEFLGHPN